MTEKISCGYNNVARSGGFAEHTYSYGEGAKVRGSGRVVAWFNCFGGHSGSGNRFPVKLYRKEGLQGRLKKTNLETISVDLIHARRIANPRSRRRINEDKIEYERNTVLKHAGLTYAVTGVCHQACNSILYAAKHDNYLYINNPISMLASSLIYGYWGRPGDLERFEFFDRLKADADRYRAQGGSMAESEDTSSTLGRHVQQHLDSDFNRQDRAREISATLGIDEGHKSMAAFLTKDEELFNRKREFDRDLLLGNYTKNDAVAAINTIALDYLAAIREYFDGAQIARTENVEIASVNAMPEIERYVQFGKTLRL